MKKYVLTICCFLSMTAFLSAQKAWSLRECVDFAIKNNIEIKQYGLQVKSAEIDLNTTKNSRLPNLNATVTEGYTLRKTEILGESVGTKALGTNFDIGTEIPVFTGFKIPNQKKVDEFNLKSAIEGLEKAMDNLELQITSYYLDILFKKEIVKVYKEQVDLTEKQVWRTEVLVESGKVPLSQLYDIKAQLANDHSNLTSAENELQLSLLDLSQILNLKTASNFDIISPNLDGIQITENSSASLKDPEEVYQTALNVKPHIKEAVYKVESSKYMLNVAKSAYWPTLNFQANYSNSFGHLYRDGFVNPSVSNQLKDNYTTYFGLALKIPIFNRYQVRNSVRTAKLNIQNEEYNLINVKLAIYKEIQQAYQNAVASEAKYISKKKAYDAAVESFRYVEERYQVGKSTAFEYSEAQTRLISSQSEKIQAKYDFVFRGKILDFYQGRPIEI